MKLIDFILDFLLPNRCGFCDEIIPWNKSACDDCISEIEFADNLVREDKNGNFVKCISVTYYGGKVKDGILMLKTPYGVNVAKYIAPKLCEALRKCDFCDKIDLVTCVPSGKNRRLQDKYNHAKVIAKLVARSLGLKQNYKILGRYKKTAFQHKLSYSERVLAAKSAYFLKGENVNIKGMTVLLCDDIITTGSTLSECAKILLEAGADKVYACTLSAAQFN